MNLFKESGEWSDELLADAAKLGVPPNHHPEVLKLPVKDYPISPAKAQAVNAVLDAGKPTPEVQNG